jgi:hypothetical protein
MDSYSVARVECEGNISNTNYAGGIAGGLFGPNRSITGSFALNRFMSGIGNPSTAVHRVAGNSSSGIMTDNSAWDGMTLTNNGVASTTPTDPGLIGLDGADLTLTSPAPVAADFSGTVFYPFYPDDSASPFAWSPWDYYPYPVFPWQIEKGIQP